MNDLIKKFTVGLVALAMTATLVPVIPSAYATQPTIAELQAQIAALTAQLQALQAPVADPVVAITGIPAGFTFARNLRQGMTGPDVRNLQIILNANPATRVAETGAGSPGRETNAFGPRTRAAVVKFQTANEITPAAGFVGPITRAALNALLVAQPPVVTPPVDQPPVVIPPVADLGVRLSTVTPASAVLPRNSRMVPVLTVDITAGTEALTVSAMRFLRTGLGLPTDWSEFHLFEGNVKITDFGRGISVDTHEIEFPTLAISIPAGQTRSYTLRGNVTVDPDPAGRQSAFELTGITSNITVPGLPVRGNLMSIGGVDVRPITVTPRAVVNLQPMIGAQDVEVATFSIRTDANPVRVEQILVEVTGRGRVTNLQLFHEANLLAEVSALDARDKAVFVLTPSFEIPRNVSRTLVVKADVSGRVGEQIITRIASPEDVIVVDRALGFGAPVTGVPTTSDTLTLQGGRLTLADLGPVAGDIARNQNDVVINRVAMTADRNLEVRTLRVDIEEIGTLTGVTDLRIKDADTGATLMGPIAGPFTATGVHPMSGSFTLTAGRTRNIAITVDTSATAGGTINADLILIEGTFNADIRDTATGDQLPDAEMVPARRDGKNQAIVVAGLTASLVATPISSTVVTGVENVPALGFGLRAAGTDVIVRRVDVTVNANTADTFVTGSVVTANTVVSSVRLMDGTTVLGTATVSGTLARITGLNLRIPRNTTRNLVVEVSTHAGLTAPRFVAVSVVGAGAIDARDPEGLDVSVTANVNPLPNPARIVTVQTAGTLTAAISPATPVAGLVAVGNVGVRNVAVTTVRYTAVREPIILEEITVSTTAVGENFTSVEIFDGTTVIASMPMPAGVNPNAVFTGLNIEIPTTGHRDLVFRANLNSIGNGATSGHIVELDVDVIRARGRNSGTPVPDTANIIGGNALTIRQSVPTVAKLANQTVLTNANDEVLRFTVAADSRGDVELKTLTVTFNRALHTTETRTIRLFEGATEIATASVTADTTTGTFSITGRTERFIAAGASRTFTVRADSAGAAALFAQILPAGFIWRDGAVTVDIDGVLVPGTVDIDGVLVPGLPVTGDTLRQ